MNKNQEPIPFPADDEPANNKTIEFSERGSFLKRGGIKTSVSMRGKGKSVVTKNKSPWLFHIGPYYFAKKTKNGNPAVLAATGFVQLSERVFLKHKIRKGDIVQIRAGWDDAYKACFAEVEKIFLESLDLKMPAPAKGGTVIIKLRNVPAGAVIRIGKSPTNIRGTRRRNPRKMLAKGK